ncbi:MAG: exodeoxyribonuclease VII large subunit [Clostridiales bacterium]|nr:exodeoxyribonuclease VII large subunit [Clostridiales bacterium]
MTAQNIYTVSQVNTYVKGLLDGDRLLSRIYIRGEVSNYKKYPSGHHYFSLKDDQGALRCVMFRNSAVRLRFKPENGMKVIAYGRVTVFPRDGAYQLYVEALTPDGVGELYVAFEQLKNRLQAEGLFDPAHKKPLPRMPETVGIVTSSAGAALHDMLRILNARWPMAQVKLLPVRVQGTEAPAEISAAIAAANRWKVAEVLIVGRGGGSMEDLWAFNDERVARAIYASEIPVISAVGHEPDVTIADFVADLRAATPSNGAELAVPDQNEVYDTLLNLRERLVQSQNNRLRQYHARLERCTGSRALTDPMAPVNDRRMLLNYTQQRLTSGMERRLNSEQRRFSVLSAGLDAMSPLKVLGRGYAVAQKGKKVLSSVHQVDSGEQIQVRLADGRLICTVDDKKE